MLDTTSMDPSILAENNENTALTNALEQENTSIDTALAKYGQIRAQYDRILEEAIRTQNPTRRTQLVSTITAMNQQLSTIVLSIQQMYQTSKNQLGKLPPVNFAADLAKYKRDLKQLEMEKDELSKLKTVYTSLSTTPGSWGAGTYNIYLFAILGMLILLLAMFTFTSLMSSVSSVVASIPLPELPTTMETAPPVLPTLGTSP